MKTIKKSLVLLSATAMFVAPMNFEVFASTTNNATSYNEIATNYDGAILVNNLNELFTAINTYRHTGAAIKINEATLSMEEVKLALSRERGLGTLALWGGSLLLGWVIDGVVVYNTGQSGGAWVAQALELFRQGHRGTHVWPRVPRAMLAFE